MPPPPTFPFPVDSVLPGLLDVLQTRGRAVLRAPPGSGKTTRVPLVLLEQPWLPGHRIVVVEPRCLPARAAASRMAAMLGEAVGETVGYRTPQDSRIGARTRIELVTQTQFLRQLQDSPALPDVGAVLFDEFHERGIDSVLALAFAWEAREALCGSTLLMAMMTPATEAGPVAALLGSASAPAPIVTVGKSGFPVEIRHIDALTPVMGVEDMVASAVRRALREEPGDVLVLLPDPRAIHRVQALLEQGAPDPAIILAALSDAAPPDAEDAALAGAPPGGRKVVLATDVAETGLCIDGIRVVVDSGLTQAPRLDPDTGLTRFVTVPISRDSAEQRRGCAGRLEPGVCYRSWTETAHESLAPHTTPDILSADLAPMALELACWGVKSTADLPWLDAPPEAAMALAKTLLIRLGAIDSGGTITPLGIRMTRLGAHPRLARMVLSAADRGLGALACTMAALLEDPDFNGAPQGARSADLRRWTAWMLDQERDPGVATPPAMDPNHGWRLSWQAQLWRNRIGLHELPAETDNQATGRVLALAYPDRIARRQPAAHIGEAAIRYRLPDGRSARLDGGDPLSEEDWLVVATLDGPPDAPWIVLAAPLGAADAQDTVSQPPESDA